MCDLNDLNFFFFFTGAHELCSSKDSTLYCRDLNESMGVMHHFHLCCGILIRCCYTVSRIITLLLLHLRPLYS